MEAHSLHLCFQLQKARIQDENTWNKLKAIPDLCIGDSATANIFSCGKDDKIVVATATDGSHALLHVYGHGLVTVDIQHCHGNKDQRTDSMKPYDLKYVMSLERKIKTRLGEDCEFSRSFPTALTRGRVSPYFTRGDESLFEMDGLQLLCERESKWQNIKIYKTKLFGNMLCLDDDIMLSEADLIYTTTLLGIGRNNYRDKTVLILGGGDGGLLHELLKLRPKHVLMVEIDEAVIEACRLYLREVCGDCLDCLEGQRYKILIDDCMKALKECLENNRKFDYVINDLAEFMVGTDIGFRYDFKTAATILETSQRLLLPGGKYLSRGCCLSMKDEVNSIQSDAAALGLNCHKSVIDVPSFGEKYCLFEVAFPDDEAGKTFPDDETM